LGLIVNIFYIFYLDFFFWVYLDGFDESMKMMMKLKKGKMKEDEEWEKG